MGHRIPHKNPNCPCVICKARRRKEEAVARATGEGLPANTYLEKSHTKVIDADLYGLVTTKRASSRDRIIQWMELKAAEPGLKTNEIAKRIGLAPSSLYSLICRAAKAGWLKFDDPVSRIDHEIIPKTLDNLSELLDQKDKSATIETAKNTVFKTYLDSKGVIEGQTTVLALKIEPVGVDQTKVLEGHVVGKPRELKESNNETPT